MPGRKERETFPENHISVCNCSPVVVICSVYMAYGFSSANASLMVNFSLTDQTVTMVWLPPKTLLF